jgi:5-methylcytosine-specific restriction endonuclease McrA
MLRLEWERAATRFELQHRTQLLLLFGSRCHVTDVLSARVLLLNRYFQAVQLTTARRAFVLLYGGAAMAVDELGDVYDFPAWRDVPVRDGDDYLPVVGGVLRVPRVVHLQRYERCPRPTVRLTRRNLMLRDGHQCQYCSKRPALRELNIDHVLPRSRGGKDSWENLVTACRVCNLRKGWRTPEEASMRLLRAPVRPRWTTTALILLEAREPFKEWEPFLKAG